MSEELVNARRYSAGVATAYGAAVEGGYTGTYAEFCAEQARFAENAQQVAEDRETVEQLVETFETDTVPGAATAIGEEAARQINLVADKGTEEVDNVHQAGNEEVGRIETTISPYVDQAEEAKDNAVAAKEDAVAAKQSIENLTVSASTLATGAPATVEKTIDAQTGVANLAFGLPRGEKGDTGYPTDDQVSSAVNTWLGNNVDPTTGYVLDRTLTQENAAAPADLVGNLKESITYIQDGKRIITSNDYSPGSYNNDGSDGSTYHVIKAPPIPVSYGDKIEYTPGSFYVRWLLIDSNGDLVEQFPTSSYWSESNMNRILLHSGTLYISVRNGWNSGNSQDIYPTDINFSINIISNGTFFNMSNVLCERGNIYRGNNSDEAYLQAKRLRTSGYIKVSANDGFFASTYRFSVHVYDNNKTWVRGSDWISPNTTYIVPIDGYVRLVMDNTDDSAFNDETINVIRENVWCCLYKPIASTLDNANDIYKLKNAINPDFSSYFQLNGDKIEVAKQYYQNYFVFASAIDHSGFTPQGMAIYDSKAFQFVNANRMIVYSIPDGAVLSENSAITSGHGDTACFSNVFYSQDDNYPLIYVSSDTNPPLVYVNRIKNDYTTELIETLAFDLENTGYYADHCIDFDSGLLFNIGYKENSYNTNTNGTNRTIISVWDLNTLTTNEDGTKTPRFIEKYELPFIITMQDMAFFDGKIFVISSNTPNTDTKIYVINPYEHRICNILTQFNSTIKGTEQEGVAFMFNPSTNKYDMYLSNATGRFYRIEFYN